MLKRTMQRCHASNNSAAVDSAIPLILGLIPRNRWYGIRTAQILPLQNDVRFVRLPKKSRVGASDRVVGNPSTI